MRFLRENLFYVVLVGLTVVIGAGELVYSFTGDVGAQLKKRTALSRDLTSLVRSGDKVNDKIVADLTARSARLKSAAAEDRKSSTDFNHKNLPVMRLKTGVADFELAFPINQQRYRDLGLRYVFTKQYGEELAAFLEMPDLHATSAATKDEISKEELNWKEADPRQAHEKAVIATKLKKAQAGMVYLEEGSLDRYFVGPTATASDSQLWEAQINLWVTREIVEAIVATNKAWVEQRLRAGADPGGASVLNSAVKQLAKMSINEAFVTGAATFGAAGVGGLAIGGGLTERTSTADYGVVRYAFVVVMPSRHLLALMRALEERNYHTVLGVTIVDLTEKEREVYYYGTEPVMKVEIAGEMLLLTSWCRDLIPKAVLDKLPLTRTGP